MRKTQGFQRPWWVFGYVVGGVLAAFIPFYSLLTDSSLTFAYRDHVLHGIPLKMLWLKAWLEKGFVGSWTHAIFGGSPIWADPSLRAFSPLNFFFLAFGEDKFLTAYKFYTVGYYGLLFWAGVFFCRTLGLRRPFAVTAALVFCWSGAAISANVSVASIGSMAGALAALGFWWKVRGVQRFDGFWLRQVWLGGVCWSAPIFFGEPQFSFIVALIFAWDFLWRLSRGSGAPLARISRLLRPGVSAAVLIAGGIAMAAVQILPSIEFSQASLRWNLGITPTHAQRWSFSPWRFFELLLPDYLGDINFNYWGGKVVDGLFRGGSVPYVPSVYFGVTVLSGLLLLIRFRGLQKNLGLWIGLFFGFWIILGAEVKPSLYEFLYRVVPGWSTFRFPERLFHLVAIPMVYLSLRGWQSWYSHFRLKRLPSPRIDLPSFCIVIAVIFFGWISWRQEPGVNRAGLHALGISVLLFSIFLLANSGRLRPQFAVALCFIMGGADLWQHAQRHFFASSSDILKIENHQILFEVKKDLENRAAALQTGEARRLASYANAADLSAFTSDVYPISRTTATTVGQIAKGTPNVPAYFGIDISSGYNTMSPYVYSHFLGKVSGRSQRGADLMGVYYIIEPKKDSQDIQLRINKSALPYFFIAKQIIPSSGFLESLNALSQENFDQHATVVIAPPRGRREIPIPQATDFDPQGKLELNRLGNEQVQFTYRASQESKETILVWNEFHFRHWKARVDGEHRDVLQANALGMAVALGPSRPRQVKTIEFYYDDPAERLGLSISALWLGFGLLMLLGQAAHRLHKDFLR